MLKLVKQFQSNMPDFFWLLFGRTPLNTQTNGRRKQTSRENSQTLLNCSKVKFSKKKKKTVEKEKEMFRSGIKKSLLKSFFFIPHEPSILNLRTISLYKIKDKHRNSFYHFYPRIYRTIIYWLGFSNQTSSKEWLIKSIANNSLKSDWVFLIPKTFFMRESNIFFHKFCISPTSRVIQHLNEKPKK